MKEEIKLENPRCFLNKETGDLFIIWWNSNMPYGTDWVEISKKVYDMIFAGYEQGL